MPIYQGLLVSCKKNHEQAASSEIYYVLTTEFEMDSSEIKVRSTRISGLISVSISENYDFNVLVEKIKALDIETPYFIHCLKFKPIQKVISFKVDALIENILNLKLQKRGSYKVEINKRHNPIPSLEIISPIAKIIDNPVNLEKPDWIILIEIIADKLGYSITEPKYIYSTQLAFREIEDKKINWFLQ